MSLQCLLKLESSLTLLVGTILYTRREKISGLIIEEAENKRFPVSSKKLFCVRKVFDSVHKNTLNREISNLLNCDSDREILIRMGENDYLLIQKISLTTVISIFSPFLYIHTNHVSLKNLMHFHLKNLITQIEKLKRNSIPKKRSQLLSIYPFKYTNKRKEIKSRSTYHSTR